MLPRFLALRSPAVLPSVLLYCHWTHHTAACLTSRPQKAAEPFGLPLFHPVLLLLTCLALALLPTCKARAPFSHHTPSPRPFDASTVAPLPSFLLIAALFAALWAPCRCRGLTLPFPCPPNDTSLASLTGRLAVAGGLTRPRQRHCNTHPQQRDFTRPA